MLSAATRLPLNVMPVNCPLDCEREDRVAGDLIELLTALLGAAKVTWLPPPT